MTDNEAIKASAERVVATVPLWPNGLPDEGPFSVPAKVWGDALNVCASWMREHEWDHIKTRYFAHCEISQTCCTNRSIPGAWSEACRQLMDTYLEMVNGRLFAENAKPGKIVLSVGWREEK